MNLFFLIEGYSEHFIWSQGQKASDFKIQCVD